MSIELRVPSLGESITEAQVGTWLKQEGDAVQADDPLVEVESEKATMAVPSPAGGVLARILRPQGATVAVGEALAVIDDAVQPAGPAAAEPAVAPPATPSATPPVTPPAIPPVGRAIAAGRPEARRRRSDTKDRDMDGLV